MDPQLVENITNLLEFLNGDFLHGYFIKSSYTGLNELFASQDKKTVKKMLSQKIFN
jgi:hypothetical protein